jgi:hypothetical protein
MHGASRRNHHTETPAHVQPRLPAGQQLQYFQVLLLLPGAHTDGGPQGLKLCAADHARQAISADGTRPTLAQRLAIGGLAGAIAQARARACITSTPALLQGLGQYSCGFTGRAADLAGDCDAETLNMCLPRLGQPPAQLAGADAGCSGL